MHSDAVVSGNGAPYAGHRGDAAEGRGKPFLNAMTMRIVAIKDGTPETLPPRIDAMFLLIVRARRAKGGRVSVKKTTRCTWCHKVIRGRPYKEGNKKYCTYECLDKDNP